jgi:hypothetical protein
MADAEKMSLVYVKSNDLLEELIEGLIRVCNEKRSLLREVVIDVIDDLSCNISFTGTRWSNNDGEPRLRA